MNIAQAKQQVRDTVEAYLTKDEEGMYCISPAHQRPLFLVGAPGIGKTAIMAQVAQELGIGLVSYSMTHHTRQSALGLPLIVHHNYHGTEYDASEYTMSEIVASVYDYMEQTSTSRGILFLDEINCVSETLYPSMLQFLQFKTFGRHRVPDDWVVVCAGNPPEYNKSVHEFDIVTLDRLRKVVVEPAYDAWRSYAVDHNIHPAVLSFLDLKKENFYSVVSSPDGKRFVTARGWEDLSETMKLFERMGKKIDQCLVEQFLQDDEISDQFATYYVLFDKYRSDYQIESILAGKASEHIIQRARDAAFDERLALIGLMLDALAASAADVLLAEDALGAVRDALRAVRPHLEGGASVQDTLAQVLRERKDALKRAKALGTMARQRVRSEQRFIDIVEGFVTDCTLADTRAGSEAFTRIHGNYRTCVSDFEHAMKATSEKIDAAFAFIDTTFGEDKEALAFIAELTARASTAQFINHFGSESYYAHNSALQTDAHTHDLQQRVAALRIGAEKTPDARAEDMRAADKQAADKQAADKQATGMQAAQWQGKHAPAQAHDVKPDATKPESKATEPELDEAQLSQYYGQAQFEYGFASLCKMTLPDNLGGKCVLDIGCRRGKGVFKLSARVGETGSVIGVEWASEHVKEARERCDRAWRDSGLTENNMTFLQGYPEDLLGAGVAEQSCDVVFVNSVVNLALDPKLVFQQIFRVMKPGALLICETVIADAPRAEDVVLRARALGNSIQAAPFKGSFEAMLAEIGYARPEYNDAHSVLPHQGYKANYTVEVAESSEDVAFTATVVHVRKPRV